MQECHWSGQCLTPAEGRQVPFRAAVAAAVAAVSPEEAVEVGSVPQDRSIAPSQNDKQVVLLGVLGGVLILVAALVAAIIVVCTRHPFRKRCSTASAGRSKSRRKMYRSKKSFRKPTPPSSGSMRDDGVSMSSSVPTDISGLPPSCGDSIGAGKMCMLYNPTVSPPVSQRGESSGGEGGGRKAVEHIHLLSPKARNCSPLATCEGPLSNR
jgi:hypothetical protein